MGFRIRVVDLLYTLSSTICVNITYNFWVSALWDAIMGEQTLADVVAGIFAGVTSAVQAVKDGLSDAWDGISGAFKYLSKVFFESISRSLIRESKFLVSSVFMIFAEMLGFSSSELDGRIFLQNGSNSIFVQIIPLGDDIVFSVGDNIKFIFPTISILQHQVETLRLGRDSALHVIREIMVTLLFAVIGSVISIPLVYFGVGVITFITTILSHFLNIILQLYTSRVEYNLLTKESDRAEYSDLITGFFGGMKDMYLLLLLIFSSLYNRRQNPMSPPSVENARNSAVSNKGFSNPYDNSWLPILTVIMDVWIFSAVDLPEDIWTMIMSYFVILTILASLGLPSVVISSIIAVFVIVQTAISAFMEGVFSQ